MPNRRYRRNALSGGTPAVRLKVVVVGHSAVLSGAELALARLLEAIPPADVDIRVILFEDGPLVDRLRAAGHAVEVAPMRSRARTAGRGSAKSGGAAARWAIDVLPFVARLHGRVRTIGPDVLVSTTLKSHLVCAALPSRVPRVWHLHDRIADDYLPAGLVRVLRGVARQRRTLVLANSRATARTVPGARVRIVHPGLTAPQVLAQPALRVTPTTPHVGMIGRIAPTKGQLEFVRAAQIVRRHRPDARFEIVGSALFGESDYARTIEKEVQDLGLGPYLTIRGHVADPTVSLDQLSVLVHASPTPEPFGQVVVEALARCVPVVATDAGGIPEILTPSAGASFGRLVPPGDVAALADAILATLADPDLPAQADRGWRHVTTNLSITSTASATMAAWREAARGTALRRR